MLGAFESERPLTFGDLANLVEKVLTVRKDDKDVLPELLLFASSLTASLRGRDGEDRVVDFGILQQDSVTSSIPFCSCQGRANPLTFM